MKKWIGQGAALLTAVLPVAASGQVYLVPPPLAEAPVTGSEADLGRLMPGATSAEYSAALVWNLRSGLNVAALVCSRSAFLDTTDNYNDFLRNQRTELAGAYKLISAYFARSAGPRGGTKALNGYDTKSYNGWSTIYAQRSFCNEASRLGKLLRFAPVGATLAFAQTHMRAFRNSLIPVGDPLLAPPGLIVPLYVLPDYPANCYDRSGNIKARCLR